MKLTKIMEQPYRRNFIDPLEEMKILQAKVLIENTLRKGKLADIKAAEFKVFSQFGDDGIIQYIVGRINLPSKLQTYVEFGVADYKEANTRFLLINNNWSGLVMDESAENIQSIKEESFFWKYDLKAVSKFINTKNINQTLSAQGFVGDIGLLHIDIDGNDYWVWKRIDVIRPIILILEYNSVFGIDRAVTVPYKPGFYRTMAHHSNLYWGASLMAMYNLSKKRGYIFLGANSAGNNAYFIRDDYAKYFHKVSLKDGYVESKYRESRNSKGDLTYLSGTDRLKEIKRLFVVDVVKNRKVRLSELT